MMKEQLKEKTKESLASVLPITVIVFLLSATVVPMETGTLLLFLIGAMLLIVGMGIFQLGAELAMTPLGQSIGSRMIKGNKLWATVLICFFMGAIITIAEPDLQVLANQVASIPNNVLIYTVAGGVGIFLVIAFLRSGSFATLSLICAGTGFAGVLALRFKPYIAKRFAAWGHVWEYAATTGYQQTRAMMVIASGGLFGLGLGNGWLKYVAASDTDLVFGFVSEEWGLLVAVMMVLAIVTLAAFVVRSASLGRSSFYNISACAAVTILMTQTILNVFGTVDILPLTGVTFPFVSNGGSSMMSAWGLLAFIKAADTRQNASFAIRLPHGAQELPQEQDAEDDIPDEAEVGADAEDESVWSPDGRKEAGR